MAVKKSKKEKLAAKAAIEKSTRKQPEEQRHDNDKPMDFGGLPDRDLKKNLGGCG